MSAGYVLTSGKHAGKTLDQVLAENPRSISAMAGKPSLRNDPRYAPWFDAWAARKAKPGPKPKPRQDAAPGRCPDRISRPEPNLSHCVAPYKLTTGKYKGQTLDQVADTHPEYIKYLISRKKMNSTPEMTHWFLINGVKVERILGATVSGLPKRPKPPTFISGKHIDKTYDYVLKRHPRYIFKIIDRGGPMYESQIDWFRLHDAKIQKLRIEIDGSKGELLCSEILIELGFPHRCEFILESLPHKRFDFMFTTRDRNYVIEIDGQQHFKHVRRFHKTRAAFLEYQAVDITKTKMALAAGFYVIRIDYKQSQTKEQVKHHIVTALASGVKVYASNWEMYTYIRDGLRK